MRRCRSLLPQVLAIAVLCTAGAAAAARGEGLEGLVAGSPGAALYGSDHLSALPDESELVFDYRFEGSAMEEPFTDDVALAFTRADGESRFAVEVTMFPQHRRQTVGPLSATAVNPILLVFFQRDVVHMSNGTGGSQHYFRNAIRRALQNPDEGSVSATTIEVDGRKLAASEITFRPFASDPNRARMRGFADKSYRMIVSDHLPGGIYQVATETPQEDGGGVLLRETYRFREVRR